MSYEKDDDGNAKLKENTPENIKEQYKEYLKNRKQYKEDFLKDLE